MGRWRCARNFEPSAAMVKKSQPTVPTVRSINLFSRYTANLKRIQHKSGRVANGRILLNKFRIIYYSTCLYNNRNYAVASPRKTRDATNLLKLPVQLDRPGFIMLKLPHCIGSSGYVFLECLTPCAFALNASVDNMIIGNFFS